MYWFNLHRVALDRAPLMLTSTGIVVLQVPNSFGVVSIPVQHGPQEPFKALDIGDF